MRSVCIERSLHILGPVLGRKRGVEVRIGGNQACTDGKVIWLPALPIDDAEAAVLGFGLLFHETNHVRYTDFGVEKGDGVTGALTNALEDIRIDALGHQDYPGGRREEEQLIAALIRRGEAKSCTAHDHPARILESYVMWRLEHDVLGIEAAAAMAHTAEIMFRETFAPGVQIKLDALMFGVRHCTSTAEVQALAQRIGQMLQDEARAEAPVDAGGAERQASRAHTALSQALAATADDHARNLGEMAQSAIAAKSGESSAHNLPLATSEVSTVPLATEGAAAFAGEVKAASNALRQRIAGLLQAQTLSRRYAAAAGRRIHRGRLARLETGDVHVFVRELMGLSTDTAVQILIDRSGSMASAQHTRNAGAPRPIEVARSAAYATALALQQVSGVSVAVAAFPGSARQEVIVLAPFGARIERCAARFAGLEARGGTPMAEAMLWAAGQLFAQRHARRGLLVTTDGAYDHHLAQTMVRRLTAAGIEALGIGIQTDVSQLFARSRQIAAIGELPSAMFDLLLEAMKRPGLH